MPERRAVVSLQLEPAERALVEAILRVNIPDRPVWVFGSRVTATARPFSDLDLGVDGGASLSLAERAQLSEAFEESDLPFRVDLIDLRGTEELFANRVRQTGYLLLRGAENESRH